LLAGGNKLHGSALFEGGGSLRVLRDRVNPYGHGRCHQQTVKNGNQRIPLLFAPPFTFCERVPLKENMSYEGLCSCEEEQDNHQDLKVQQFEVLVLQVRALLLDLTERGEQHVDHRTEEKQENCADQNLHC